jgi:hypothetical protein
VVFLVNEFTAVDVDGYVLERARGFVPAGRHIPRGWAVKRRANRTHA